MSRKPFTRFFGGRVVMRIQLRNAEGRPRVLQGKGASQGLWHVGNPKGKHSIARLPGSLLVILALFPLSQKFSSQHWEVSKPQKKESRKQMGSSQAGAMSQAELRKGSAWVGVAQ